MHEPIISEELFEQAQKALHSRKIQPCKDSPHHVDPDVFSGLFRCEACGTAMRKHRTHNGKYICYVCGHHQQEKFACSSHYINCNVITRLVREDIKRNAEHGALPQRERENPYRYISIFILIWYQSTIDLETATLPLRAAHLLRQPPQSILYPPAQHGL